MKTWKLVLIVVGFAGTALALDKAELDNRIRILTTKFEALQAKPDKCIPVEILSKAQGVLLLDRTKAGFMFAYQGGGGVALVKDPVTAKWSPAAFVSAREGSLGAQLGGQRSFIVILFMKTNATRLLTEPNFEFGGEARGTGGNSTAGVEGTVSSPDRSMLAFDDRKGLYGGAAIKGDSIAPDDKANIIYYGQAVTMKEILFDGKVGVTEAASQLASRLSESAKLTQK